MQKTESTIVVVSDVDREAETIVSQLALSGYPSRSIATLTLDCALEPGWSVETDLVIFSLTNPTIYTTNALSKKFRDGLASALIVGVWWTPPPSANTSALPTSYSVGELVEAVERVVARPERKAQQATETDVGNRYEDLFRRASDTIILADFETHEIADVNEQACRLYGYSRTQLIGMSLLDLVPREQHAAMLDNTRTLGAGAPNVIVGRTHLKKDGTRIEVSLSAGLVRFNGRLVFQDIVRDETKRKKVDALLRARAAELIRANDELKRVSEALRHLTLVDELTQVANRRAFEARFEEEWRRLTRSGEPVCILFLDVDHFKRVNDTHGHSAGDEALRAIGGVLAANCQRASDVVARYGGEEFVVLLSGQDAADGERTAERLRLAVAELSLEHNGQPIELTASLGVAATRPTLQDPRHNLIAAADEALYRAKQQGRNQVVVAATNPDNAGAAPHDGLGEQARLAALQSLSILDTRPEERFDRVTRMAKRIFDVEISLVSLVDASRQWFKSSVGLNATETSRDISFCHVAIERDGVMVVPDALADERFRDNPLVTGEPNIRFYAGCPIRGPSGHKLGTLCIIDPQPRTLSGDEIEMLSDLAAVVERELAQS